MSDARALVGLFVDFAGFRQGLRLTADDSSEAPTIRDMSRTLRSFASGAGRIGIAQAYADWSLDPEASKELVGTGIAPVLVPATTDGEDRSHIRLTIDAMRSLFEGDEPDAFVLVSGEPTLVPLMQILRAEGCEVIVVAPDVSSSDARSEEETEPGVDAEHGPFVELASESDQFFSMREVFEGKELDPVVLRPARAATRVQAAQSAGVTPPPSLDRGVRFASPGSRATGGRVGYSARDRGSANRYAGGNGYGDDHRGRDRYSRRAGYASEAFFDGTPDPEFTNYLWGPFVRLIDELEERLPFVGVRYLVNKVLGPHNCGIDDPRQKRNLINQAVDEGIIEMYSVGNVDDRLDPVTACRLDRRNTTVEDALAERDAQTYEAEYDDNEYAGESTPFADDGAFADEGPAS